MSYISETLPVERLLLLLGHLLPVPLLLGAQGGDLADVLLEPEPKTISFSLFIIE